MSEKNRSAKRRRLSSKYEHATPSKTTPSKLHSQYSAPKRMRDDSADEAALFDDFDGAHDVGRNQSSAAKKLTNGIPRSIQRTPAGSASSPRKNTAKKMAEVKPVENGVQTSGEPSGSEDDTNEPRRSSRKRKSTAKGAEKSWLPNGGASAHKEDSGSSDLLSSIDVASPGAGYQLLLEAVDVEPPSQRKRGRPRRVSQGEAEQHMQEQTPRKLGRPRKTPQGEAEQHAKDRTPRKLERPSKRFEDELRTASNTPRGTHRQERHSQGHTPSKRPRQVIWDDDEDELGMDMDNIVATPKSQGGRARKPEPTEIHSSSGDVEQDLEDDIMGISPDVVAEAEFPNRAATTTTPIRYSLDEHDNQLGMLVTIALEKLAHRRPVPLTHLDDEYAKVYQLVEATVVAGEGNSMLVVGTRGAGKTTLMNKVLLELSRSQNEHFHVVHLNGFIQTDDKLALREIWRQLGKEMDTEEESGKSYSDTLAMLLALLSHPDEIAGEHQDKVAKSVIFVMDEFDHFASHPRQTLLYNLLDIAQSRKAPIAVLGLTTKIDITESFEKRVKSRFSHRYVHLSLAKSLMAFQDICKSALLIQPEELNFEEKAELLNRGLVSATKKKSKGETATTYLAAWNKSVHALFTSPPFISNFIRPAYYLTKSVQTVMTSLILPLSTLPLQSSKLTQTLLPPAHFLSFSPKLPLVPPPSNLPLLLPSLSDLQLSLLIAAARLDIIHDSDTCSFGMAYMEYVDLASKARLQSSASGALASGAGTRVWGREVARGEWEALVRYGLLVPVSESGAGASAIMLGGLVRVDIKLEEIPGSVPGLSTVLDRWCRQI